MPNYDYYCSQCGHEEERFHSMSAEGPKTCPRCQDAGFKRRIGSGSGIIFKGPGFYETDYKSSTSAAKDPLPPAAQGPKHKHKHEDKQANCSKPNCC